MPPAPATGPPSLLHKGWKASICIMHNVTCMEFLIIDVSKEGIGSPEHAACASNWIAFVRRKECALPHRSEGTSDRLPLPPLLVHPALCHCAAVFPAPRSHKVSSLLQVLPSALAAVTERGGNDSFVVSAGDGTELRLARPLTLRLAGAPCTGAAATACSGASAGTCPCCGVG